MYDFRLGTKGPGQGRAVGGSRLAFDHPVEHVCRKTAEIVYRGTKIGGRSIDGSDDDLIAEDQLEQRDLQRLRGAQHDDHSIGLQRVQSPLAGAFRPGRFDNNVIGPIGFVSISGAPCFGQARTVGIRGFQRADVNGKASNFQEHGDEESNGTRAEHQSRLRVTRVKPACVGYSLFYDAQRLYQDGVLAQVFGDANEICGAIDGQFREVAVRADDAALLVLSRCCKDRGGRSRTSCKEESTVAGR